MRYTQEELLKKLLHKRITIYYRHPLFDGCTREGSFSFFVNGADDLKKLDDPRIVKVTVGKR